MYVLQILIFALLSAAHVFLTIKSGKYALFVFLAISLGFFFCWMLGIIFKLKLLRFVYKFNSSSPAAGSLAGAFGVEWACYEDAAKRFPKFVRGLLYCAYITLVLGIVIVFSVCLYTNAF